MDLGTRRGGKQLKKREGEAVHVSVNAQRLLPSFPKKPALLYVVSELRNCFFFRFNHVFNKGFENLMGLRKKVRYSDSLVL